MKKTTRKETGNIIHLDIRSSSVSLVCSRSSGKIESVIYSDTKYFSYHIDENVFSKEKRVVKMISEMVEKFLFFAIKNKVDLPDNITVNYSSPWFVSKIENNLLSNENSQIFTDTDYLVENRRVINQGKEDSDSVNENIEASIVGVYLNGYLSNSFSGKKYRKKEFRNYFSSIPRNFKSQIEGVVQKHIPGRPIFHRTLPNLVGQSIKLLNPNYRVSLVILHGEFTDICFFDQGVLVSNTSVSSGYHGALRNLMGVSAALARDIHEITGFKKTVVSKLSNQKEKIRSFYDLWAKDVSDRIKEEGFDGSRISIVSDDSAAPVWATESLLNICPDSSKIHIIDRSSIKSDLLKVNTYSQNVHLLSIFSIFAHKDK